MDSFRFESIKALFGNGIVPEQTHVDELKKSPSVDPDEVDDLLDYDITAYNNLKTFSENRAAYIASLKITRQKVFVQRLAGLPEDSMPDTEKPTHSADTENAASHSEAVTGLALENMNDLMFDDDDAPRKQASGVDTKSAPAHNSPPELPEDNELDEGNDEGNFEDDEDDPYTFDPKKFLDVKPTPVSVTKATEAPPETPPPLPRHHFVMPPVQVNLWTPGWVRAIHATEHWQKARRSVEQACAESKNSDPAIQASGKKKLEAWNQRMKEYADGLSGPELIGFGERMLKCIRDLRAGADPEAKDYNVFYVDP